MYGQLCRLEEAALSSNWSCQAIFNVFILDVEWSPELDEGWIDGWRDHCDTLSHVIWPCPLTLCSRFSPHCSTIAVIPSPAFYCSTVSSLVLGKPISLPYLVLKHRGHWDQPVTLYIDVRPREQIWKQTKKHLQADYKNEKNTRNWRN